MNFNELSPNWKIHLFWPTNICIMLLYKFSECLELPLNWIYVLLQDITMWLEFRRRCKGVDWSQLTLVRAWDLVLDAGWAIGLFAFSSVGIHSVLIQDLLFDKPEYCDELMKRLGLK